MNTPLPPRQLARNRQNAAKSTGPTTPQGKTVARANALKHGLTANPAAGVIESPERFEALLAAVEERFRPRDLVEAALIHRIATAIWRLQRATRVDAAITGISVNNVPSQRAEVQCWIDRIMVFWRWEFMSLPEPRPAYVQGLPFGPEPRLYRLRLAELDDFTERQIMASGTGITAVMTLLQSLVSELGRPFAHFHPEQAEQLAWALGDLARWFPLHEDQLWPAQRPSPTDQAMMIDRARRRPQSAPLPDELLAEVRHRLGSLSAMRMGCAEPFSDEAAGQARARAMLPDAETLERLLRYETHADRTLSRALETLAKLRGVRVDRIAATLAMATAGGGELKVAHERTRVGQIG